ncbi:sugar ABC transporter permease [Microbacterium oryzae]|uniref:carbohydrate ABC transporter permease n=1 Tax=Microbacterium oryzae TaxID=743009 RepID=UPI0025AF4B8C|nr:sugar ABC transporter permease [Microbacterium oryzae]MDN3310465.1 sugar ABC transporter permease [Microbacterium oryzae]
MTAASGATTIARPRRRPGRSLSVPPGSAGGRRQLQRLQVGLYLLPAVALVTLFLAIPLAVVVALSTTEWAGVGAPEFVSLENFGTLFGDPAFLLAVRNTVIWVLVGVFIHTPLCILVALVIARKPRGWKILRTILFLPNILSATALALLWYFVFHVSLGLINAALTLVGLESWTRNWLFDPFTALGATMTPWVVYIGFGMVLFLTQISTIPQEYYEAAQLDGASTFRQDWSITIPLIRRAIALQVLFVVGYALRSFEYPFIMTSGGPANESITLSLYIYKQMMTANQYGLAMAAGVVTLAIGALFTAAVFLVLRRAER